MDDVSSIGLSGLELSRNIENFWTDPGWLAERMLFLSGPRQVGKTTLVQQKLLAGRSSYFNWDDPAVRRAYQKDPHFYTISPEGWICFDEIHKRNRWKDILKGIYDTSRSLYKIVVTGSARLDTFKRSGDSLVGRYFHTHLFPINLADLSQNDFSLPGSAKSLLVAAGDHSISGLKELLATGGFPEPFLNGSATFCKRWRDAHRDLITSEDLRDLSRISELDKVRYLLDLLEPKVGNLATYRSLGVDLEASHQSVRRWLEALEKVNLIFGISPYSKKISKAIKAEKKWYFVDWSQTSVNRFENYIAASLYRSCTLLRDRYGERFQLHFIRTQGGSEVDFLVTREEKPWLLIEAKQGQPVASKALHKFQQQLQVPAAVVTERPRIYHKSTEQIYCLSWDKLASVLP